MNDIIKGQRIIAQDGEDEVTDAVCDWIEVQCDKGDVKTYAADEIRDNNYAG